MKAKISTSLDDYLNQADQITEDLMLENGALLSALREYHDYFTKILWREDDLQPVPALLSLNAFMLYLAGIRVAMSGHTAAMFPVLRTALESGCYAYRMSEDESLCQVWLDRNKGDTERKLARRKFNSAVRETADAINKIQDESGSIILEIYERTIDEGAHPNVASVIDNISFDSERNDGYTGVSLVAMYGHDSWQTRRALVACLDYGFVIALVLTCALNKMDQRHQDGLNALNELKERVVAEVFG